MRQQWLIESLHANAVRYADDHSHANPHPNNDGIAAKFTNHESEFDPHSDTDARFLTGKWRSQCHRVLGSRDSR